MSEAFMSTEQLTGLPFGRPRYSIGVDIGQLRDYTTVVIAEIEYASVIEDGDEVNRPTALDRNSRRKDARFIVRAVERAQDTSTQDIERRVAELYSMPALQTESRQVHTDGVGAIIGVDETVLPPVIAVDRGGLGAGVCDSLIGMLGPNAIFPVMFTNGSEVTVRPCAAPGGGSYAIWRVPKYQLISYVVNLFEKGWIEISPGVDDAEQFKHELRSYTFKETRVGNQVTEARRESDHDDLIMSLTLLWFAYYNRSNWRLNALRGRFDVNQLFASDDYLYESGL